MAAQALVSSSLTSSVQTARQILGTKPAVSVSQKKTSFVVKAASTPPVKVHNSLLMHLNNLILFLSVLVLVSARSKQTIVVCVITVSLLLGWQVISFL